MSGPKKQRNGSQPPDASNASQPVDLSPAKPADNIAYPEPRPAKGGFAEVRQPFIADLIQRDMQGEAIYGALDLGTNNCRLIIVRPSIYGFSIIDTFSRIIRLGEGLSQNGYLSKAAMDRAIEALRICADKMQRAGVNRSRLIATEACRSARNADEFLARVEAATGLRLEIITREMEARLAVAGCASLLDRSCDWALVFDIGGGSSELVWLDLARLKKSRFQSPVERLRILDCIVEWTSLPVGVVNLAERHGGRNVDEALFDHMTRSLLEPLRRFEAEAGISRRIAGKKVHFLGTSGTVTTIAGVHLSLPAYSRSKVDGTWLSAADVRKVSAKLLAMGYDARVSEPCIGPERADLVLAGCAILEAMLRAWPCERLRVADRGLREGILMTLMAEDGQKTWERHWRRFRPARSRFDS